MIVGDPSIFAIESSITKAYEHVSLRALGFFVLHIGGLSFGRRSADSTMLACSFDEVGRRLTIRGTHMMPVAADIDAEQLACAFRDAIYGEQPKETQLGIPLLQFKDMIYSKEILWAPDGDEAFDDGSYVLQFDIENSVRLVAFKSAPRGRYDPLTIRDVRLTADSFYSLLREWYGAFEKEWAMLPKAAEANAPG